MKNGMPEAITLLKEDFESSATETKQFSCFARTFRREFHAVLKEIGCENLQISKGHFDIYGFFTYKQQIYYFSISDVRWFKEHLMIRTATDYKDYTGGTNNEIPLNYYFPENLKKFLEKQ